MADMANQQDGADQTAAWTAARPRLYEHAHGVLSGLEEARDRDRFLQDCDFDDRMHRRSAVCPDHG
jgi:hypothetical protein